jgi:hypothetical protein
LLHCCYTVITLLFVTMLLHCWHTVVTLLTHRCYTVVTLLSHCCYTIVTLLTHSCYTVDTQLLHCCHTVVTGEARARAPVERPQSQAGRQKSQQKVRDVPCAVECYKNRSCAMLAARRCQQVRGHLQCCRMLQESAPCYAGRLDSTPEANVVYIMYRIWFVLIQKVGAETN